MPPKRSSCQGRRSKQPAARPRRAPASTGTSSAISPPSGRTISKSNPLSNHTKSKVSALSNRAGSTTNASTAPGPTVSRGPQAKISSTPLARVGLANTNTPNRRSASSRSAPLASARNSRASCTRQAETTTAAPKVATQPEMDVYIESELHNAIFHDPNFLQRFLSGATDKLQQIDQRCRANNQHYGRTRQWPMPEHVPNENALYDPILNILNTIKRAVDHVHPPPPSSITGAPDEPPQPFIDSHKSAIPSDLADTNQIKPDLVLFHDNHRHWENVRMTVEVKTSPGLHKAGIKQLSRYARATFAHQLHRRHLYGLLVCRSEATFVRFDRAGILYSKRMDVVKDGEAFTRAFASLLMLDRIDEGYDPAFTFERNDEGRLVYYIDLPESAFAKTTSKSIPTGRNGRIRRFKVSEILCHRESICGRATIVLRIHEQLEIEGQHPEEYALKIIWRDPERDSEGEVLQSIHGRFGLAQSTWHCDMSMSGKCSCPTHVENCTSCVDKTVQVDGLQVCDKLQDINIVVPAEIEEQELELEHVDTTECHPTSYVRPLRIYSYILMASIGVPLWQAESPRRLLTAILDAILGYWGAFNLGIMHQDISDGNVMMLQAGQPFARKEWIEPRIKDPRIQGDVLIESEAKLRSILEKIGHRDPTGMLSDFDLHAMHSSVSNHAAIATNSSVTTEATPVSSSGRRLEEDNITVEPGSKRRKTNSHAAAPITAQDHSQVEDNGSPPYSHRGKRRVIDFRTGTPAFMSCCVLKVKAGIPYHHHFLDDIESFFWLILWSAAAHLDEGQERPTYEAQAMLNYLNQDDLHAMWGWKRGILLATLDPEQTEETLEAFGNEWGSNPMLSRAICGLGSFLSGLITERSRQRFKGSPGDAFYQVVMIFLDALCPE
ncbi:hypothetical protein ACGC1H_005485 [Rhizoctonia solani]|uniref:Fungal-type protein kinase domain-containing protein n=1 Tax=Rhizoctonia solani TaxID=456999 RepID=A0A8H2WZ30_9AGAM|nr:unnamed protein product [Rhizoctonia solani]